MEFLIAHSIVPPSASPQRRAECQMATATSAGEAGGAGCATSPATAPGWQRARVRTEPARLRDVHQELRIKTENA